MKTDEVRRFLNKEVVGQKKDGLFFEGRVEDANGKASVEEPLQGSILTIDPDEIRWLVLASRHC